MTEEMVVDPEEQQVESEEEIEVAEPVEDTEAEIEEESTEDEELVVTFGEEETPPQEDRQAPSWVKELRQKHREQTKRNKQLEQELEKYKQSQVKTPEKPTLASCDYDEIEFERKLNEYNNAMVEVNKQKEVQQQEEQKHQEEWQNTLNTYAKQKESLKVKDYEEAEATVEDEFDVNQQAMLLNATQNPALVVYALGKNTKALNELSGIKDPVKFAASIARMETTLKTNRRRRPAPAPDEKLSGSGSIVGGNLDKLRAEAARTGDYSKVIKYKKQMAK